MELLHSGTAIIVCEVGILQSREEAKVMFPEVEIIRTDSRRLVIATGESDWENAHRMSGCECVLTGGGIAKWESIDALLAKITVTASKVRWQLNVGDMKETSVALKKSKAFGGLFYDNGSTFDLDNPKHKFGVVLDNSANYVAWGWMVGQGPGKHGWSAMCK